MASPMRGSLTDETQIEVTWTAIVANSQSTGGSPIDSYNLLWKVKDSYDDYKDLVG